MLSIEMRRPTLPFYVCESCRSAVDAEEGSETAKSEGRRRGVFKGQRDMVGGRHSVSTRCLHCGVTNPWPSLCVQRHAKKSEGRLVTSAHERIIDVTLPRAIMPCVYEDCASNASEELRAKNTVVFQKMSAEASFKLEFTCTTCMRIWS